jgi:small GTP-binding protein
MKKKLVIGILAHVDAGKTTLSESLLFLNGKIRRMGRVDNQDTYLDTYALEKARGITIFSKQAVFEVADTLITLLDTPGHVDFSTEMERTLQVLDYAILVISGADGVQGHTRTLWNLLATYGIPVFIFINKMDQNGTDREKLMHDLKKLLGDGCIDFSSEGADVFHDQLAMCDEDLMDTYLEEGHIPLPRIQAVIRERMVFPCFFGSALRLEGVEEFLQGIVKYTQAPSYPTDFGARIFKIGRDEQGNRLTYMKITGGRLKARDVLSNGKWEEKVNQIRIYSGQKFESPNEAEAGTVCAVRGLTQTKPGEGLGCEKASYSPVLEPVLTYQILLPQGCDPRAIMPKLRQLEEEDPELHIIWDEQLREIQVQIMGEVQLEILQSLIKDRFGLEVSFDSGKIVYKETIANTVEGVGHFEPLRHYAEVHLLLDRESGAAALSWRWTAATTYWAGTGRT